MVEAAEKELWFDVERRYKTILTSNGKITSQLWFDVERRYKTMRR